MKTEEVEKLEELLSDADEIKQVLRVHFVDHEVYDLTGFFIGQDFDEDYPHCYTTVIEAINTTEKGRKVFSAGVAMMLHLNDIVEVRDAATEKLLFKSQTTGVVA